MTDRGQDTRVVSYVRVVAHTSGPIGPPSPMSENHWSIYLLLAETEGCVRMNMMAEAGYINGRLEYSNLPYTQSYSALQYWDLPLAPGTTVGYIVTLVEYNGRDHYWMSGGGSGCRWWCYTIVTDLAGHGYLTPEAPAYLWPNLLVQYSRSGETRALAMVEGTFTEPEVDDGEEE